MNIYFISTSSVFLPNGFFPLLLPVSCFGSGSGRLSRVAEVRVAHCLSFGFYYSNQCCSHHGASLYLLLITHSPPPRVPICSAGVGTLEGGQGGLLAFMIHTSLLQGPLWKLDQTFFFFLDTRKLSLSFSHTGNHYCRR